MQKNKALVYPVFWKGKRVLITGFSGFLGSHMTRTLAECGASVTGLDIVTKRALSVLTKSDRGKIRTIKGSVEDYDLVSSIIKYHKIEYIFHLAAKSQVGECLRDPLKGLSTNIIGTCNVLEAARHSSMIKGLVVASSDKAYGSCKNLPYDEDSPMAGDHPYDVSKSCADLIARTYFITYTLPVCIVRCGNIYGPGDFNFSRVVPDAVRSAIHDKTLVIRSDGKFTRDYIYIKDAVGGYLALAEKMKRQNLFGQAFNFSNESPVSVLRLVNAIYKLAGKTPRYKILNRAASEIVEQYLSANKARRVLGWRTGHTLEEGLIKTIEWYKGCLEV